MAASVTDGNRYMRANTSAGSERSASPLRRCEVRLASSASSPGSTSTHHECGDTISESCVRLTGGSGSDPRHCFTGWDCFLLAAIGSAKSVEAVTALRTRAVRSMLVNSATLRCETVSNVRSDSISSSMSSMRTGRSQSLAKRSIMPPRRAKVPGVSTALVVCQPLATSQSESSAGLIRPPFSSRRVLASISRGSSSGVSNA